MNSSISRTAGVCIVGAFILRFMICLIVSHMEGGTTGGITTGKTHTTHTTIHTTTWRYTDIDLDVFEDAADLVAAGKSAFDRHTYRYTPLLAHLIHYARAYIHVDARMMFCTADVIVGCAVYYLTSSLKTANMWWLFNPVPINICTRGSAESFIVLMPVMATLCCLKRAKAIGAGLLATKQQLALLALAGVFHGLAVHCKIYPVIYSLSYAYHVFSNFSSSTSLSPLKRILPLASFTLPSLLSFSTLTYISYTLDGPLYLDQGLFYHFGRTDHRHNYAMHWYLVYLAGSSPSKGWALQIISRLSFVPQSLLIAYTSLKLSPLDLHFCVFLQTLLFVTTNKVVTGQYFTWYLCLLPLCSDRIRWPRPRAKAALSCVALTAGVWCAVAFLLEMRGESVHMTLFCASAAFFAANVGLFWAVCTSYEGVRGKDFKRE